MSEFEVIEHRNPRPVVIDTDPGVDDALAIVVALRSPELRNASKADASLVDVAFEVDAGGVLDLVTERVFGTGRPLVRRADVVVVGGANTDLTVAAPTLPRPGETVAEGALHTGFGGKGANQAVAARRAGAEVAFVARMGEDEHAERYLDHLRAEGIDTGAVSRDPRAASGVALIMVDAAGHNQIAVAPGANARLRPAHLKAGMRLIHAGAVVVNEIEAEQLTGLTDSPKATLSNTDMCGKRA